MSPIRIFISSPGDVELERQVARRVIAQLQAEFGGNPPIEPYFWEYEPMRLTVDFQGQIPRTSTFDIVVCILWSRLGTPLGPQHRRPDGTAYQSGTEFEFEDAAESAKARGVPDLLVYRNRNDPIVKPRPKEARERQLAQFDALDSFLEKWTRDGQIRTGALTSYSDLGQFEERFGEHLRKLIRARCPADAAASVQRPATWSAGSPFRGLHPFEFEHAPVFRGRTRAIQDVIALLRGQYASRQSWAVDGAGKPSPLFVLVSAMSGIGKSSLIRAGVLPLLTVPGVVEQIGLWRRAVMKPGSGGLFVALAEALTAPEALPELISDGTTKPMLAEMLRSNPAAAELLLKGGLSQAAARLYAEEEAELRKWETQFAAGGRAADAQRARESREALRQREAALALLVDQFEESFTGDKATEAERNAFLVALDALSRSGRVFTMATVRSDFLARASELALVGALLREGALYQLEPPTMAELAQIIREPAREAGLAFEQERATGARLDDVLLAATQGDPAALPLLEFALDRLYEKRDADGLLTFKAYREMDQVEGALAQSAESCFSTLSPAAAAAFERVFAALVNLAEVRNEERPVRRRAAVSELSRHPGAAEFIDRFAAARLLVLDKDAAGNGSVAVVHEALFSHWARLAAWIEQNRDHLRVRRRIEQAATRWEAEGRPTDLLLPDGRLLAEAQEVLRHADLLALSESVRALVRESTAAQRSRRIRRVAAVAILTAGLAVAGVVSWYQYRSYQRNQIEAKLFDYRQAARDDEMKFLAHVATDKSIKDAYDSTRQVLGLIDEIKAMRGEPPEGWEDAAAKAHEFGAVLLAEMGDVAGSGREIEARKSMAPTEKTAGLKEVLDRNPAMMSYALTVFDLKLELMMANEHLTAMIRQNPSLDEALRNGMGGSDAAKLLPPATDTRSETERERDDLNYSMGFINLLNYMTQTFGREKDFSFLDSFLRRAEDNHEKLGEWDNAEKDYQQDAAACLQWLDLARKATYVDSPDDRARMKRDAARRLVNAKTDLARFYSRRKDYAKALATAQDAVQTLAAQAELADEDDLRFGVRKLVVSALVSLDRGKEAFTEAQSGTEDRLEESRDRLLEAWSQTGKAYGSVEDYWVGVGVPERAVEVAQRLVDVIEKEVQSAFDIPSESNLAGAYASLSWRQLFAKRFADAQATAEKGLQLPVSEVRKAVLNTNLAHALLLQGETEKALGVYEAWKAKPVESKADYPKLFAQAVLDDFAEFDQEGLLKGIDAVPAIRAEMQAVVDAAPKPPAKAAK